MSQFLKIILKHLLTLFVAISILFVIIQLFMDDPGSVMLAKPVIYLYPEEVTDVSVELTLDGKLTTVYPAYHSGWQLTAQPNGTLTDSSGREYYCLYWEAEADVEYDLRKGFCIPGNQTAAFLEDALTKLGLTERESNEFIIYWLPQMETSPYNLIAFQTEAYTDAAQLTVSPAPDTMIRVFMTWKELDTPIDIQPQPLSAPTRNGFTVVEWGGSEIK